MTDYQDIKKTVYEVWKKWKKKKSDKENTGSSEVEPSSLLALETRISENSKLVARLWLMVQEPGSLNSTLPLQ